MKWVFLIVSGHAPQRYYVFLKYYRTTVKLIQALSSSKSHFYWTLIQWLLSKVYANLTGEWEIAKHKETDWVNWSGVCIMHHPSMKRL